MNCYLVSRLLMVADSAAMYFLFPGPDNQQAFETTRNLLQAIIEQEERWG